MAIIAEKIKTVSITQGNVKDKFFILPFTKSNAALKCANCVDIAVITPIERKPKNIPVKSKIANPYFKIVAIILRGNFFM